MSEMKHTMEIQPDPHGTQTETRYASGFRDDTGHNQRTFIPCDLCDGTGKVKAVVTVEWEADYES